MIGQNDRGIHGDVGSTGWQWHEGEVSEAAEHFEIHHFEEVDRKTTTEWGHPVARVGRSGETVVVHFLTAHSAIRDLVKADLETFVLEDAGVDPWTYLKAWTGRFGNAYSETHWSYWPEQAHSRNDQADMGAEISCWEKTDYVSGDEEMTSFRRAARKHQCEWRERNGLKPGGPKQGAQRRLVGSWLDLSEAEETYANFLSKSAGDAARDRIANPQKHEAPLKDRLLSNLLASMPMCFNLFGDLWADHELATTALKTWVPDLPGAVTDVRFEWSPGRSDPSYLNNRTAFDVAFIVDIPDGTKGVIGVETKYHEFAIKEAVPRGDKLLRYTEVSERSNCFKKDWPRHILGSTLQQLWLDHLLALSMTQHPSHEWTWAKSLVVFPHNNSSFATATESYRVVLENTTAFETRTVETLLDAHVLLPDLESDFRERYLW
ncbi:MAG: hypothetical protein M3N53_03470 [Actinomycetota bacterium]|nr:hypothetical protein [Actinomycetota bacterium]